MLNDMLQPFMIHLKGRSCAVNEMYMYSVHVLSESIMNTQHTLSAQQSPIQSCTCTCTPVQIHVHAHVHVLYMHMYMSIALEQYHRFSIM